MKPGTFRGDAILITMVMLMLTLVLASVFISIPVSITRASVTELNVEPEVVNPGEVITITGKAAPGEEVWVGSSFELSLPVSDGKYSREFNNIHFPAGEKKFSVTAERIKNIRVSLYPVFWRTIEYPLEGPLNATNGAATIAVSFPVTWHGVTVDISGKKNVKVYGAAAEDATAVTLKVGTSIKVIADSNGVFSLDINTEGVPEGEFMITGKGAEGGIIEKIVYIGVTSTSTPTSSSTGTSTSTSTSTSTPTPSPSPTPSLTPSPSPSPTPSPTPTATSTPTPMSTPATTPVLTTPSTPSTSALAPGSMSAPAPTSTPTPTPTPTPSPSKRWMIPGFDAIFAIAGLLAVAYLVLRERTKGG